MSADHWYRLLRAGGPLPPAMSGRKLRLFACAVAHHYGGDTHTASALRVARDHAEGAATDEALGAARDALIAARRDLPPVPEGEDYGLFLSYDLAVHALGPSPLSAARAVVDSGVAWRERITEVFGDPRAAPAGPNWLTPDVLSTCQAIHAELAHGRSDDHGYSALGDALEDAGCADDAWLRHCRRQRYYHSQGCWVVDAILGRR